MGNVQMEARQIRYGSTNVEDAIKNAGGSSELESRVDALEEAQVFSTTETKIGKWGDQDLFRKIIEIAAFPNKTFTDVSSGLSDVTICNMYGFAKSATDNLGIPVPLSENNSILSIVYRYADNTIRVAASTDRHNYSGFVVLEYTKNPAPENNNR